MGIIEKDFKDKVLPCPFCHKKDHVSLTHFGDESSQYYFVSCFPCADSDFEFFTMECNSAEKALERWNNRAEVHGFECPFCGSAMKSYFFYPKMPLPKQKLEFVCAKCGARTIAFNQDRKEDMLKIWERVLTEKKSEKQDKLP